MKGKDINRIALHMWKESTRNQCSYLIFVKICIVLVDLNFVIFIGFFICNFVSINCQLPCCDIIQGVTAK